MKCDERTLPLKVAILGASGIGKVHARIFSELGAEVFAILGSSESSAKSTALELKKLLGLDVKPFWELERLFLERTDVVSICTPPSMHFAQILSAFDRGISVFTEKPLFWESRESLTELIDKIFLVENHTNRHISVNTSNSVFIDAVRIRLPNPTKINRFSFIFHTKGNYRGIDIAVDLLPHGLSLLIRLLGIQPFSGFDFRIFENQYQCNFQYGKCNVNFDFQQGLDVPSLLEFQVNSQQFRRIQKGFCNTYEVQILDVGTGEFIQLDDPFRTYISSFLEKCKENRFNKPYGSFEDLENLRLMAKMIIPQVVAIQKK